MATKFLEPGGDATFNTLGTVNGFWTTDGGFAGVVTDFVHGTHIKSLQPTVNSSNELTKSGILADAGSRFSFYFYVVALPSATIRFTRVMNSAGTQAPFELALTSAGVLQVIDGAGSQVGTNGATLSTGQWYRISVAYTITSTAVNRIEVFVNGASSISITNGALNFTATNQLFIGFPNANGTFDVRYSDIYVDDSSALTDPGDIWVTAKRPNANGTTNNFNTQIGAGGSGYGTGHSPQVNERPLSTTNGWSVVAAGATTEEYNIESKSTGDINLTNATIVDYIGWVSTKALVSETGQIILNNVTSNISIISTITMFFKVAGSTTYPAGTGTDIGLVTSATATTVSLYECGVVVAFIPGSASGTVTHNLNLLGVGT